MGKNNCYTYFYIVGNFEPDMVSKMLNLKPFKICSIDDKYDGNINKIHKAASWSFGLCEEYSGAVEEQMLKTIKPLMNKIDILNNIKRKYDVDFFLEVVPTVYCGESTPCLAPTRQIMQFCCETETDIDIDLYVND